MQTIKMLNQFIVILILLSVITLNSCDGQEKSESDISAKEVPQAVLQAFNQAYPGADIKSYAEETEDGQKYYEISSSFEGRKIDALYHSNGSVAAIEEVITESQLPDAVNEGFASEIKNGSIYLAEKIEKEGKVLYELKAVNNDNGEKSELVFSDAGKLIDKEVKNKEKEESEKAGKMHKTTSTQVTIPTAVKEAFQAKFSGAEEVEWGMESANEFEAEFEINKMQMSANFDPTGKWLETETILPEKKLPATIQNALKKNFAGYEVEKAEKLEKAGEPVVFEIKMEKGEIEVDAIMNEAGELIKKEVKNEEEED